MDATVYPEPTGTLHLQAVGLHPAIEVERLVPGCVVVWNFGSTTTVREIARVSRCFVNVTLVAENGDVYERRMRVGRKIGYSKNLTEEVSG